MTDQIIEKLIQEIRNGLTTEAKIVYVLVEIRKILERENQTNNSEYNYLVFHCDWVLHASMDRRRAQQIIAHFEEPHSHLLRGGELSENSGAQQVAKLELFREQLSKFLRLHSIPDFPQEYNNWARFIYLYFKVVEDCALEIRSTDPMLIRKIVVTVTDQDKSNTSKEHFFKVSWQITDKNEKSGSIFVINSFKK